AELAALEQLEQLRGFDVGRVQGELAAKLADWLGLLSRNVVQARQALRSLLPERLTFTAKEEDGKRFYIFEGTAVLDRLLSGIVLPKALVAPRGFGIQTCYRGASRTCVSRAGRRRRQCRLVRRATRISATPNLGRC